MKNNHHYEKIYIAIQDLEEICGPETVEEYIKILTSIKSEINKRLDTVWADAIETKYGLTNRKEIIEFFKDRCGPHIDPDIESFSEEDLKERYELARAEDSPHSPIALP